MICPHCRSRSTRLRRRTALGYRRFWCASCRRRFNERTGTPFNELQYPTDVVLLAALWRLRCKLGFRNVAELLQCGHEVTHETTRDWEARFVEFNREHELPPQLEIQLTQETPQRESVHATTGPAPVDAGHPAGPRDDLLGTAVIMASRICDRAEPAQVLVSRVVTDLCAGDGFEFTSAGDAMLKSFDEQVALYDVSCQDQTGTIVS